jgi:hypothetical protein
MMRKTIVVLAVAIFTSSYAFAQSRPESTVQQLTIVSAVVSEPTITIRGANFGTNPAVFLPGASLSQLQLQPPTTNEMIVAFLPADVRPGTYVLVVSRGRATTDTAAIDLTLGAIGPAGPTGPTGATGATGPAGPIGPAGPKGADGVAGKDGVNGLNGLNGIACWDLNGNRLGDPGEDRNGDGSFTTMDCQGPAGPRGADGLGAAEAWSAKRTGFVAYTGSIGSADWTTIPGLSQTFSLQRDALVQLLANGSQRTSSGIINVGFRFLVDGVGAGDPANGQLIQTANGGATTWSPWTLAHFVALNAGTHTIQVQVRNTQNSGTTAATTICGQSGQVSPFTDCTFNTLAIYH